VSECEREASMMRRSWSSEDCCAIGEGGVCGCEREGGGGGSGGGGEGWWGGGGGGGRNIYIYNLSPYRAVNTLRLGYKNQSVIVECVNVKPVVYIVTTGL